MNDAHLAPMKDFIAGTMDLANELDIDPRQMVYLHGVMARAFVEHTSEVSGLPLDLLLEAAKIQFAAGLDGDDDDETIPHPH